MLIKCTRCGSKHKRETSYMAYNLVKCQGQLVAGKMPFMWLLSYSKNCILEAFDSRPLSFSYRCFRFTEAFLCFFR